VRNDRVVTWLRFRRTLLPGYGRVAGTASGYNYSKGKAGYATTWDETTLNAFLTRPRPS